MKTTRKESNSESAWASVRARCTDIGSGLYIDPKTGKKYDYEEDVKGNRHYFEVWA